jgi:hypothetical protein
MKPSSPLSVQVLLLIVYANAFSADLPVAGFFLRDSVHEMTLKYRTIRNLIVLPVTINDSVHVNLILDTGCRNLILFGRKFKKLLRIHSAKEIQFSGLGTGISPTGLLSLGNKVSINDVLGERIPIVIVSSKNVFSTYHDIHGVIGYDIFLKFEIELNAGARTITFRPGLKSKVPRGYSQVPLRIEDARPVISSWISINKNIDRSYELMIDTGSSLGLLLKTTRLADFLLTSNENILGLGFNGPISGYLTVSDKLTLMGFEMISVPTGVVLSNSHDKGSIGMEILKDYIVILNYCRSYACFKRNSS